MKEKEEFTVWQLAALAHPHNGKDAPDTACIHGRPGNRSVILVSALGPLGQAQPSDTEVMIRQPIITQPGKEREVLVIPVAKLASILRGLSAQGLTLEHIFDY